MLVIKRFHADYTTLTGLYFQIGRGLVELFVYR
jgi:hypothetical protein